MDGAKERVSSQPRPEPRPQGNEGGEEQGSSGEKKRGEEREGGIRIRDLKVQSLIITHSSQSKLLQEAERRGVI